MQGRDRWRRRRSILDPRCPRIFQRDGGGQNRLLPSGSVFRRPEGLSNAVDGSPEATNVSSTRQFRFFDELPIHCRTPGEAMRRFCFHGHSVSTGILHRCTAGNYVVC